MAEADAAGGGAAGGDSAIPGWVLGVGVVVVAGAMLADRAGAGRGMASGGQALGGAASGTTAGVDDAAVRVPHTKLVVGLAAGWCGGSAPIKAVCIDPTDVGAAYGAFAFRGGAFWNVEDDGSVPSGSAEPLFIARGLAEFLHTRGRR